ncbi:RES domain-containing protein [Sphingomonas antarctica]|uniref:RES family NAD+ phosphorylase n=1 Tax=Sphingomonas antarctica TaxID=2040274 RepID=UPI0039E97D68
MTLPLRTRSLRAGTVLHRIHRLIHDPIYFGPTGAAPELRYDDPDGVFKVLYLARKLETAFGETLVRLPTVTDVLSTDVLVRARSEIVTTRALRLYPLDDAGVSAHGLRIPDVLGDNYAATWKLSAYIHANTAADGIAYISRFNGGQCIALFDHAAGAIARTGDLAVPLTPELGAELAGRFGKNYVEP